MTPEICKLDIDSHPVFNLKEQIELMDASRRQCPAAKWQHLIGEFFTAQGRFTPAEFEQVDKKTYVTDKFLKMVKTPIPTD